MNLPIDFVKVHAIDTHQKYLSLYPLTVLTTYAHPNDSISNLIIIITIWFEQSSNTHQFSRSVSRTPYPNLSLK